jgi:hypothetical protein
VVPARERRSRWHLIALWITLAAWVLAGVRYLALAALAARTANAKALLGFAWPLRREAGP